MKPPVTENRRTIVLSAGHHPKARGAHFGDFYEYPEAVLWVTRLAGILRKRFNVVLIPTGTLTSKVARINELPKAHLCLEIHFNACGGCAAKGSETLYMPGSALGKDYAELVQQELGETFPPSRGAKEGWFKMDRPGLIDYEGDVDDGNEQPDYFLRATRFPALIIEPEFVHNKGVIQTEQEAGCQAIARGIVATTG